MVAMVGLGSFWMGNLPPCTQVGALKVDQTHLVREPFIVIILDTMYFSVLESFTCVTVVHVHVLQ